MNRLLWNQETQGTYISPEGRARMQARVQQYKKDSKNIPKLKGKQPKIGKLPPSGYHVQYNQFVAVEQHLTPTN